MRTKLSDRKLPNYSSGEELFNMVSHTLGAGIAIAALVICVVVAAMRQNVLGIVSSAIYGTSMILLYSMSSIYHGLRHEKAKKVMQILDHCAIYIFIAGTYTPIALSAMKDCCPALGWTIFGIEWGLAILATVFTAIDLKKYRIFSMACYIVMGWLVIVFSKQVIIALTLSGFKLMLAGGVLYTLGAIIYAFGSKAKYLHNVFHVFVLAASITHLISIAVYAL